MSRRPPHHLVLGALFVLGPWSLACNSGGQRAGGLVVQGVDAGLDAGASDGLGDLSEGADVGADLAEEAGNSGAQLVEAEARFVNNLTTGSLNLFVSGAASPAMSDVASGTASEYRSISIPARAGRFEIRRPGESARGIAFLTSAGLGAVPAGARMTVVAAPGPPALLYVFVEGFGPPTPQMVRLRWANLGGSRTIATDPDAARLYTAAGMHIAAAGRLGDSGPEGALFPAARDERDNGYLVAGLPGLAEASGFWLPAALLAEGNEIMLWQSGPDALQALGKSAPLMTIPRAPYGRVIVANAVPDAPKLRIALRDARQRVLGTTPVSTQDYRWLLPPVADDYGLVAEETGTSASAMSLFQTPLPPVRALGEYVAVVTGFARAGSSAQRPRLLFFEMPSVEECRMRKLTLIHAAPGLGAAELGTVDLNSAQFVALSRAEFGAGSPWLVTSKENSYNVKVGGIELPPLVLSLDGNVLNPTPTCGVVILVQDANGRPKTIAFVTGNI